MGNTNDSMDPDQKAMMKAAQNAAKDKEVQDTMKHAANKPEVQNAAKSAMNDENVRKAAMNAMVSSYTNDPNAKNNNKSLWKALSKNKEVQNAAVTLAKDKKVQKTVYNQVKKNKGAIKSGAMSAFKFGMAAHKASKSSDNGGKGKGGL